MSHSNFELQPKSAAIARSVSGTSSPDSQRGNNDPNANLVNIRLARSLEKNSSHKNSPTEVMSKTWEKYLEEKDQRR